MISNAISSAIVFLIIMYSLYEIAYLVSYGQQRIRRPFFIISAIEIFVNSHISLLLQAYCSRTHNVDL